MDDLENYIHHRKRRDPEFAQQFELGYVIFKLGILVHLALRLLRRGGRFSQ